MSTTRKGIRKVYPDFSPEDKNENVLLLFIDKNSGNKIYKVSVQKVVNISQSPSSVYLVKSR